MTRHLAVGVVLMVLAGTAEAGKKDAHLISYGGYATTDVAVVRGRVARGKPDGDRPGGKARKVSGTAKSGAHG